MALGRKGRNVDNTTHEIDPNSAIKEEVPFYDAESNGEKGGRKMSRVAGVMGGESDQDSQLGVGKQLELEATNAIKYRTCSWQKTAALLFAEYICLAIMSFPYSYSILGLVPGLIVTVVVAMSVLYTSLLVWEFCLRHPEVRDVCDVGQMLYFGWQWVWYFTAVMFLLNNTFIQGLHVLTGAKYLNTMSGGAVCTVGFSAIWAVLSFFCSLPRTFDTLSKLATASAIFTFISVLLAAIFAAIEPHPNKYDTGGTFVGNPIVLVVATKGTSFVNGMNAFLNISYTFIGQITIPSFIAEMKEPKDFPKALWAVTICEVIVFSVTASIVYVYTGTQYNTSPAFGSLGNEVYKKVSFSFMIPTLIFLGVLYASVSARFIFFRIFEGTRHKGNHTVIGWASWAGILGCTWILAFIIAEVIPFFSDLLSLMSSLFDSFFGFIFWGTAYMRMRRADYGPGWLRERGIRGISGFILNVILICIGLFMLTGGTYATCQSIVTNYNTGMVGGVFTCRCGDQEDCNLASLLGHFSALKMIRCLKAGRAARETMDVGGKHAQFRRLNITTTRVNSALGPSACSARPRRTPLSHGHDSVFRAKSAGLLFLCRQASNDTSHEGLNCTALHELHVSKGGKMVPFGGYSMPVQYSDLGVGESHKWTREKASLFDVGHMVQHRLSGPGAAPLLEKITPSSTASLATGHSTLSCLLHPATGGIVDDTVITRLGPELFYLVTNAACKANDVAYLKEQIGSRDTSHGTLDWEVLDHWGLVALQGPLSAAILQGALARAGVEDVDLKALYFGQCKHVTLKLSLKSSSDRDTPILISRGGYTGEDGFEISIPPALTVSFTTHLLESGGPEQLRLAGLGARDSLRLEAGMCLYGHDLDDKITPVEAGLSWIIHKDRRASGGFHGDETILRQLRPAKDGGSAPKHRRVGLIVEGAPAREGAEIIDPASSNPTEVVGTVTSGCPSPTLGKNIAMGYIKNSLHKVGTPIEVIVRGKRRQAKIVKMPFVKSQYWKQAAGTSPG